MHSSTHTSLNYLGEREYIINNSNNNNNIRNNLINSGNKYIYKKNIKRILKSIIRIKRSLVILFINLQFLLINKFKSKQSITNNNHNNNNQFSNNNNQNQFYSTNSTYVFNTTIHKINNIKNKMYQFSSTHYHSSGAQKRQWIKSTLKSYGVRRLVVCLQVVLIAFLMSKAVMKFQMLDNKTTVETFSNTECAWVPGQNKSASSECNSGYGFNRILFFYNDGLARDLSDDLVTLFQKNSNTFRIQNEGFPASYAVFTSYMTGSAPTNFMGAPLASDNIIYQMTSNGNMSMSYYGTRMPAYDILEKGDYFDRVEIEETTKESKLYQSLFVCNNDTNNNNNNNNTNNNSGSGGDVINHETINSNNSSFSPEFCSHRFLNEQLAKNQSIFFSGDVVDERNHQTGDKYDPTTLAIIQAWINDMASIKKWVDQNPDYLLVIFSDHGGKLKSETAAHGKNDGGNEAFMIIYNPTINPLPKEKQDLFIDQVDVCSTIWQYFVKSGVSLPAENIGKVSPTHLEKEQVYNSLKLNADQFNRFGQRWGYKMNQNAYEKAVKDHDSNIDESIELFTQYINDLKIPFLNLKRFPVFEVVFFPICIAILIVLLMQKQYGTFGNLFRQLKSNPEVVLLPYLVIFGLSGLFSGFWVLYWHDDNESIHVYISSLLAALVMYYTPKATHNERTFQATDQSISRLKSSNGIDYSNYSNNNNNNQNFIQKINRYVYSSEDHKVVSSPLETIRSSPSNGVSPSNGSPQPQHRLLSGSNDNSPNLNDIDDDVTNSPILYSIPSSPVEVEDYSVSLIGTPISYEYKPPGVWLVKYAFFSFFMAVVIYLLTIPLEDLFLIYLYKGSYIIGIIFLIFEFYVQRRKLLAHLVYHDGKRGFLGPVYVKFGVYLLLLAGIYIYDRSWRVNHVMLPKLALVIYLVLGLHSLVLLFCPRYIQADIFLPFSLTVFFLSNDKERFYLLMFVIPQFYCVSNVLYFKLFNTFQPIMARYRKRGDGTIIPDLNTSIYQYSLKDLNFFAGITDHFLPLLMLLMTSIALTCYKSMQMNFQIGDVAIYVPGVFDPPSMPVFSGFIMSFHKLGYFFLLGAFLIKLANPCPPALVSKSWFNNRFTFGFKVKSNRDYNNILESLNLQIWGFLLLLLLSAIFFFHLGYYNFMVTKAFVFTVTMSVIVIFYGVSLITSYIGLVIYTVYKHFSFGNLSIYQKL